MADSNYHRGTMDIEDHSETFGGFMTFSRYGGAAIIVGIIFPILIFGVNLSWPVSMIISVVLGIILGVIMRFHGRWYAILIGMAVLVSIGIVVGKLAHALMS